MYGGLDISTSGMVAQRTRLNVISANIANADAVLDSNGDYNPYHRRIAMFAAGGPGSTQSSVDRGESLGVHVAKVAIDDSPLRPVYDPANPLAAKEDDPAKGVKAGYVYMPNVDNTIEQINVTDAVRAYQANVAAAEASKTMMAAALQLLA